MSAILGRCPSACERGRRVRLGSVSLLSTQGVTVGIVTCRRHLPTWITSGMLVPDGTPVRWKAPVASDSVAAIGMSRDLRAALVAGDALPGWRPAARSGRTRSRCKAAPCPPGRRPCPTATSSPCPCRSRPGTAARLQPRAGRARAEVGRAAGAAGHAVAAGRAVEHAAAAVADRAAVLAAAGRAGDRRARRDRRRGARRRRRRRPPPPGQSPHASVPPQPSPMLPQYRVPAAGLHVSGTHPGDAQMPVLQALPRRAPGTGQRPAAAVTDAAAVAATGDGRAARAADADAVRAGVAAAHGAAVERPARAAVADRAAVGAARLRAGRDRGDAGTHPRRRRRFRVLPPSPGAPRRALPPVAGGVPRWPALAPPAPLLGFCFVPAHAATSRHSRAGRKDPTERRSHPGGGVSAVRADGSPAAVATIFVLTRESLELRPLRARRGPASPSACRSRAGRSRRCSGRSRRRPPLAAPSPRTRRCRAPRRVAG